MPDDFPSHDTTSFLDEFRTAQISHLLVAAVTDFDIGGALTEGPMTYSELRFHLELADRPAIVLLTALRSIGLIDVDADGRVALTPYGREKMSPASSFSLRGYVGLGAGSADVRQMVDCLKHDRPAGGLSFVYHEGQDRSALDDPATSHLLTGAMADRARNVAPFLAAELDLANAAHLLDVGGGHGIYSYALLERFPNLRGTILDRQPALDVAFEYAEARGLGERVRLLHDDAHTAELEEVPDVVLMANLLHDYNERDAAALVEQFARRLPSGGRLMVLDSLLNPVPPGAPPVSDGPRAVAAYSALLFSICEGRCYRRDEVETWLHDAGLEVDAHVVSLPAHGSLVTGWKR